MSEFVFVGREAELNRMNSALKTAAGGNAQVLFISGEAGAGKSSLVREFVNRAEEQDPKLISTIGECNAQTGISDPYLPFRQILTSLTTEENIKKAASKQADDAKKLDRWKEFVRVSSATLITLGPELVSIFVPGAKLLVRLGSTIAYNTQLASKLSDRVVKKDSQPELKTNPALDQQKIFEQYTNVLKALSKDQSLVLIIDDLQWADVQAKLEAHPQKLSSLNAMESTGGEPDVVGYDKETGEYLFYDCSAESPGGRRNVCYDGAGEQERLKKGLHPGGNAVDAAAAMGNELLTEAQYRELQELGEFDTKTSSWIKTPPEIRDLGGAIFADCRYNHIFVYHNSAPSFYSSRGFRGALRV